MTENQVINVQSSSAQVSIPAGSLQVSQVYTIRCDMVNNSAVIAKVSFCIVGFELYILCSITCYEYFYHREMLQQFQKNILVCN